MSRGLRLQDNNIYLNITCYVPELITFCQKRVSNDLDYFMSFFI